MQQIRKIIQLRLLDPAMSIRTIAGAANVSRPVVKDYLMKLAQNPLDLATLESMNDAQLRSHMDLTPQFKLTDENRILADWLDRNINDLSKTGFTRLLLHERYLAEHPGGLQYTQFCFVLKRHYQGPETSTLLNHKAGDKMYIDFTGNKLYWSDTRGNKYCEEIFIAVLGASSCLYALPVASQRMRDFCYATEKAFHHFGGVTRAVVPDCLKSAVLEHDGYESRINPLFQRLMDHYGTICLPARPRKPKDYPEIFIIPKM
jgi:hypothetical protein